MYQTITGQVGPLCLPISPKKKLVEKVEYLLPVKFRSAVAECLSQSEARVAIFVFWLAQNHKLGRGLLRSCFPSRFVGFVQRMQNGRKWRSQSDAILVSNWPDKFKFWLRTSRSSFCLCVVEFRSAVTRRRPSEIRSQLGLKTSQKNTNSWEKVELFLPVKFCRFPISSRRE